MTTIICVVSYSRFAETLKELDLTGRYTSFRDAQDPVQAFSSLCSDKLESVSGDPRSPAASSLEVQMGLLTLSPQLVDLLAEDFPGRMTSTSETKTDRCVLAVNANTFLSGLEALEDRCLEVEHEIAVPGTVTAGVTTMAKVDPDVDVEHWFVVGCSVAHHSFGTYWQLTRYLMNFLYLDDEKSNHKKVWKVTSDTGNTSKVVIQRLTPKPRSHPSAAYFTLRLAKMTSNPNQDSQTPNGQSDAGDTSQEAQDRLPNACDIEIPMNELPQQLQYILYVIERVRDRLQFDDTGAVSANTLKDRLEEVANFAKRIVFWVHETEIESRKRSGHTVRWNSDFDGHWENLLEDHRTVEEVESVMQRRGTRQTLLRRSWVKNDAKASDACCRNLRKWKEEFLSEARRIIAKNMLDNKRSYRDKERHNNTPNDTEGSDRRTLAATSNNLFKGTVNNIGGNQTNHYNCDHSSWVVFNGPVNYCSTFPDLERANDIMVWLSAYQPDMGIQTSGDRIH
ncbi:hypothetical protein K435DRAFT_789656 [Dendrothele bispora CBS 962.96]|uniref:Uncharacterized protein n=1 Tax=Dendrothele bispora (strain CBS 962.96) TaxID=1314807 RepID=A0A4S8MV01_DENBC|nr:hypothetical protein K435DRAFT_789656 [Dendrothele bispora CBS 962.96]